MNARLWVGQAGQEDPNARRQHCHQTGADEREIPAAYPSHSFTMRGRSGDYEDCTRGQHDHAGYSKPKRDP
jgi:hypothetical protein